MKHKSLSALISSFNLFVFTFFLLSETTSCVDSQYEACVPKKCGGQSISYPFWIQGEQESYCGYPGFELTCQNNHSILQIPENNYTVQEIFYGNQSIRISVSNLGSECLPPIRNLSLEVGTFKFASSDIPYLHILSNCSLSLPGGLLDYNRISCEAKNENVWGLALAMFGNNKNLSYALGKCETQVLAPVELNGYDVIGDYMEVLRRGFVLQWKASNCNECKASGGRCGFDASSYQFRCFCKDRPHRVRCKTQGNPNQFQSNQRLPTPKATLSKSLDNTIVSHLVIVHSTWQDDMLGYRHGCPQSFDCGKLGPIKFPFSNDTYPRCGLCPVNCSKPVPKLHFWRMEERYEVKEFLNDEAVKVSDKFIRSNSCDIFSNLLPPPPRSSISYTISPNLTLFKCPANSSSKPQLQTEVYSYSNCPGYTVYYTDPNQHTPTPANPSSDCVVIQLPMLPSIRNINVSDLFSLLAFEFTIWLHVSKECLECHHNGGQCRGPVEFHCIKDEGKSNLKLILGAAAAAAGVGILLILLLYIRKLFQSELTESYQNVENFLTNYRSLTPKRYTYSDIKKMTNSFRVKLGQGGFGCVFKGKLENGCFVAVKVLEGLKGTGEEFINEVVTISRTSHVNIVTLVGFCFEGRKRALMYEFMPNGSLEKFIYDRNSSKFHQLGWEALYRIAIGISRGLEYLHRGCNMRILHFDIKPHNILLDEDFRPKISDFGLAKLCPQKESIISLSGARGTIGYIAPEVFSRNFGGVSHKSDVYSYGMLILEMVGGRKGIDVGVDQSTEIYFPEWIYKRLVLNEELGLPDNVNDEVNESARKMIIAGLWCIQTDPSHRPSMSRVVEMLEGSLESLQIPPKPFLSSPSNSPAESSTTHTHTS
ncbi:unnamed protein product [Camellia sinensis]